MILSCVYRFPYLGPMMLGMCELYNVLDSVYMVLSLMCSSEEKEKIERKNFMNDQVDV